MPPYQILVLNSGVRWSLLLDIRCLWRHHMMSYSHLQTSVLAKFVDTTCIFRDAGATLGKQSRRHGGVFWGLSLSKQNSKTNQSYLWSIINRWSFYQVSECQAPRADEKLLKTFWRRFCWEGWNSWGQWKHKKSLPICFYSATMLTSKNKNRNDKKSFWIFWVSE